LWYNYYGDNMSRKTFRNLDEQIELLKAKGLAIKDIEKTKDILLKENYFFINGYRFLLMENEKTRKFIDGTTFEELYSVFVFDRYIRNTLFKNLLIIENNIKSIISYQLSRKYGHKEKDYLNPSNFNQDPKKIRQVKDLISKMQRQIRANGKQHRATFHYISNYGYIPMWVLVKVLSFGIVSELFSILKNEDKETISSYYGIRSSEIELYLSLLANYRNLCAHEDMLFDNRTQRHISNTIYHEKLGINKIDGEYMYGKKDLFALIIILKVMLSKYDFEFMMDDLGYEVDRLDGKISSVPISKILDKMGFPVNFRDITKM